MDINVHYLKITGVLILNVNIINPIFGTDLKMKLHL